MYNAALSQLSHLLNCSLGGLGLGSLTLALGLHGLVNLLSLGALAACGSQGSVGPTLWSRCLPPSGCWAPSTAYAWQQRREFKDLCAHSGHTTRVSSAVNGQQPCEEELDHEQPTRIQDWKPAAGQVEYLLMRTAWSQQRDLPVRGLMWCSVVAPRKPPHPPCSSQAATQPAASEPGPSIPPPAKRTNAEQAAEPTQPTKGKGNAAKAKPAPQPGRWLDRDCNAVLNMQRIGESRWRPLELCWWPDQAALPAKCKEYPVLGYKRL
ncbi:hypothetical protein QJQ45_012855 [Haematococcus lacustris]|nr:hypothetical protein QJQ45_012855 [Haematococcus lacustris]